jgi:DNA polymerase
MMSGKHPVSLALGALSEILEREKLRGKTHLAMREETAKTLNEMPMSFMMASQKARVQTVPAAAPASAAAKLPGKDAESPAPADGTSPVPERTEAWARKELNAIFKEVKSCEVCRSLGTLRETVVFATGNPMADLMFIGEAPGAEEEKERKPFVGPAGQKLTRIIKAMGLSREEVYISNIVKFRPKKGDGRFQGTSNRKPDPTEIEACIRFLRREIAVVAPKIIVALGATAAEGLLQRGGPISSLREQTHEFAGVPVVVTYHPSFLLRQESEPDAEKARASKRKVWEDMLKVMEQLGMPVSEKQRGFFSK